MWGHIIAGAASLGAAFAEKDPAKRALEELGEFETGAAMEYAEEIGLSDMAKHGYGRAWEQNFIKGRIMSMRPEMQRAIESVYAQRSRSGFSGMESGITTKNLAGVVGSAAATAGEAEVEAQRANEVARQQAQGQWMNVLAGEQARKDRWKEQKAQLETQQMTFMDRLGNAAALYGAVAPAL